MRNRNLTIILFTIAFLIFNTSYSTLYAQVGINEDNSQPDASALLDVKSTNKGVLIPRMTTSQRTGINSPAQGLLVYDNTTNSFWYYKGTAWTELGSSSNLSDADNDTKIQVEESNDEDIIRFDVGGSEILKIESSGIYTQPSYAPTSSMMVNTVSDVSACDVYYSTPVNSLVEYQSFTATTTGKLDYISIYFGGIYSIPTISLHNGHSPSNNPLTTVSGSGNSIVGYNQITITDNIILEAGQVYSILINNSNGIGECFASTNAVYPDGLGSLNPNRDFQIQVHVYEQINTGNVTADAFIGDGSGLTNLPDNDNQDLTLSNNTLSLTNDNTTVDLSSFKDSKWTALGNDIWNANTGNVGIGVHPTKKLDVNGNGQFTADGTQQLIVKNSVNNANPVEIYLDRTAVDAAQKAAIGVGETNRDFFIWYNGVDRLNINESGLVGIGRMPQTNILEIEGQASKSTAGDWIANSDARLKKNIQPLASEQVLNKLLSLQGVTYEWNDTITGNNRPTGIQYGFTAQNIQEIFPTLVEEDNLGYLQTAYGTYDAMYVEAFRALNDKVEKLEKENEILKAQNEKINQLEAMLQALQQQVNAEKVTVSNKN